MRQNEQSSESDAPQHSLESEAKTIIASACEHSAFDGK